MNAAEGGSCRVSRHHHQSQPPLHHGRTTMEMPEWQGGWLPGFVGSTARYRSPPFFFGETSMTHVGNAMSPLSHALHRRVNGQCPPLPPGTMASFGRVVDACDPRWIIRTISPMYHPHWGRSLENKVYCLVSWYKSSSPRSY